MLIIIVIMLLVIMMITMTIHSIMTALLVYRYLSNTVSFVLCVDCRVTDHHNLLHDLSFLKNACVRQVVIDK